MNRCTRCKRPVAGARDRRGEQALQRQGGGARHARRQQACDGACGTRDKTLCARSWAGSAQTRAPQQAGVFSIFIFFKNIFYRNIFSVSHFIILYPYRSAGGGRDLHVNKHKFLCAESPGGSLPPPCRAVGLPAAPPPGGRGLHAIELKF